MTYQCLVTVEGGGTASVTIADINGQVVTSKTFPTGRNQPSEIVLGNIGDVLEFTTDPGTTITISVTQGTETV